MDEATPRSQASPRVNTKKPRPLSLKRHSTPSCLLGSSRREQIVIEQGKPDMATCFLQYCAMCEKQIMTPCNSILYCSEACRRKDSSKPLAAANVIGSARAPPTSPLFSPRPVLFPRTPTGVGHQNYPSSRIPSDVHNHKSDLDPTEWKPKLPHRQTSEAFRYLSQFHRSMTHNNDTPEDVKFDLATCTGPSTAPTPSLANTPTTAPSSFGTSVGYNGYDFNTRPLPPRPNRWYSANAGGAKEMDLVTPHIPPPIELINSLPTEADQSTWERKSVGHGVREQDGLSVLFGSK